MLRKIWNKVRGKAGFTLTEIIICVAILAIIGGINMYSTSKNVDEARVSKAKAEVGALEVAIAQYNQAGYTPAITDTTAWSDVVTNLKTKQLISTDPAFTGQYSCTYSMFKAANGPHVKLTGCLFHTGQISVF